MEIVLQWIDELDDLICTLAFLSFRARRGCLQLGLATALGVQLTTASAGVLALVLGAIALASVAVWSAALGGSLMLAARSERVAKPT